MSEVVLKYVYSSTTILAKSFANSNLEQEVLCTLVIEIKNAFKEKELKMQPREVPYSEVVD